MNELNFLICKDKISLSLSLFLSLSLSLSLSLYIYIYIYIDIWKELYNKVHKLYTKGKTKGITQ